MSGGPPPHASPRFAKKTEKKNGGESHEKRQSRGIFLNLVHVTDLKARYQSVSAPALSNGIGPSAEEGELRVVSLFVFPQHTRCVSVCACVSVGAYKLSREVQGKTPEILASIPRPVWGTSFEQHRGSWGKAW